MSTGINTKLVHSGEKPDPETGAIAPVLIRTKTFAQPGIFEKAKWQYSRCANPTRSILENKIVDLCGGGYCATYGTGDAATTMFLLTLNPGDHILFCHEVYGGTYRLVNDLFNRFGIESSFVNFNDKKAVKRAVRKNTKYLFVETPTNPSLSIVDLRIVQKLSKELGIPYVADLTFSPPNTLNGFDYDAEIIIYSLSKYFGGHNDALGGALVTRNKKLYDKFAFMQWSVGAVLSPDESYRIIQELKTLTFRWEKASQNAYEIASWLHRHKMIRKVNYPGLRSHPGHLTAKRQNVGGYGSVVSFDLKKSDKRYLKSFVNRATKDKLIVFGESLASPETILAHPSSMSHRSVSDEDKARLGITDGFFRLSAGFEDTKDIIRVLDQALS